MSTSSKSTSTSAFAVQTYVFDPRPAYPLQIVVKRYARAAPGSTSSNNDAPAPALVFAHGTGFLKELWEPVLDDLAALVGGHENSRERDGNGEGGVRLGDIWAVDSPNHGDSALLNREVLKYGYEHVFGWEEYARALHLFVNGLGRLTQIGGVEQRAAYPFSAQSVIGVGHSMGSVALGLSLTYAPSPDNSFAPHPAHPLKALILVEPMIMLPSYARGESARLIAGAEKRRDTWPSRQEAEAAMRKSLGRQRWEERCVRGYVEYGLRYVERGEEDGAAGKDDADGSVTLKCTKVQEAASYRDPLGPTRLFASFGALVKSLPVHVMYGAVDDYLPPAVKVDVVEIQAGGVQNLASYARVPGGGHLVPFQSPTALAEKIFDALRVQARVDAGARGMAGRPGTGKANSKL